MAWRIKTREEFGLVGNNRHKIPDLWNRNDAMNYLYGVPFPDDFIPMGGSIYIHHDIDSFGYIKVGDMSTSPRWTLQRTDLIEEQITMEF